MNFFSLTASLIAGVVLVVLCVAAALCRRKIPELKHGIMVFLMGPGALGGLRMFLRCVDAGNHRLGLEGDEKVYFAVGAICLVWTSLQEGVRAIKTMHS